MAKAKHSSRSIDSPQNYGETATKPSKSPKKPSQKNMLDDDPPVKDDNDALAIAADILLSLLSNIWWRLLQDPDGKIDVSTASRQELSHINPSLPKSLTLSHLQHRRHGLQTTIQQREMG